CLFFWHSTNVRGQIDNWMGSRLSSAQNTTFSLDDELAIAVFCRFVTNAVQRICPKPKSERRIGRHADADGNAECLFIANAVRLETFAASGLDQRLRVSAGRASFQQHRTALIRLGSGRKSGRVRRKRIESDRLRGTARESDGAALGPRRGG